MLQMRFQWVTLIKQYLSNYSGTNIEEVETEIIILQILTAFIQTKQTKKKHSADKQSFVVWKHLNNFI